jgi:hypothetical protein
VADSETRRGSDPPRAGGVVGEVEEGGGGQSEPHVPAYTAGDLSDRRDDGLKIRT